MDRGGRASCPRPVSAPHSRLFAILCLIVVATSTEATCTDLKATHFGEDGACVYGVKFGEQPSMSAVGAARTARALFDRIVLRVHTTSCVYVNRSSVFEDPPTFIRNDATILALLCCAVGTECGDSNMKKLYKDKTAVRSAHTLVVVQTGV